MGSLTQLMPGETQGCIGCHEPWSQAPPTGRVPQALRGQPRQITPPPWGAGPVDFVRHVQPVFDRYCVGCHGGKDPRAGMDLSGDKTRHFNMAYENLVGRGLVDVWFLTPPKEQTGIFPVMGTGSMVSKVVARIEKRHSKVDVDDLSRRKLHAWIDANVPYYATYEHTRPGTAGSRDAWAEPWFKQLNGVYSRQCASCHGRLDDHRNSRGTWVNLTRPEFSRLLSAPLAKPAGGLALCKPKAGRPPARFADTADPTYQAMLAAIRRGNRALLAKPRMDMPGGKPIPYERNFGRLYRGGGR